MTESTYTVPALRDTANGLRTRATAHFTAEEIKARALVEKAQQEADAIIAAARREAEALMASADEIDAHADRLVHERETGHQQGVIPCSLCGLPMVHDGLGWKHQDPYAKCTASADVPVASGVSETGPMPQQDGGDA